MSSLGIYLGPKVISIAESKGKKLLNSTQIPQSTISAGELEEKVPPEAKIIEIIALLKSEMRKSKIEADSATLCLSGKDLIIRNFEIPALPRDELHGAVNFEAKKYIPFKVEDLISDFQLQQDKATRTNMVLFMGVKKETLNRYVSILSQLNIKINAIEYAGFSVLRLVKLAGLSDKGIIGVLAVDLQEQDEVNFTVLENGFPLFSRDISLAGGPEEAGKTDSSGPLAALEKLKAEVRVSLGYYHRKFPAKSIEKIFFIANHEYRSDMETFMMENGISSQFIDVARLIGKPLPYSLSFIKSYSSSLSPAIKTSLKVDLLAAKTRAKPHREKEAIAAEAVSLFEGLRIDPRAVILGLLICAASFGWGIYRKIPFQKGLQDIIARRPEVATVSPEADYEELSKSDTEYKKKLTTLNNLIKKQLFLTEPLAAVPAAMPEGVWLNGLTFNKAGENTGEFILKGIVYLADSNKEFEAANKFLSNLKENAAFTKYFQEVNITSLQRAQLDKVTVTNFLISCRTAGGRK